MGTRWAIIGGMGPLASMAFLESIYEKSAFLHDQEAPSLILDADTSCPDRTELLLSGREDILADHLQRRISRLLDHGVDRVVICCVTIHAVLDRVDPGLRRHVASLIDVIAFRVLEVDEPQLVLCTTATKVCGVLQAHPSWQQMKQRLVFLSNADQRQVQELLYDLKRGKPTQYAASQIKDFLDKYSVRWFVACCTELHIVARRYGWAREVHSEIRCVDPLDTIAEEICVKGDNATVVAQFEPPLSPSPISAERS